ncbi:non-oxidative hydroxyarylic acid decarboxylases subunit D [Streptomyces sp. NPDC005917]|uniref:non-oxidative hydroxyarylic acid decarboxylases subunit D n=1 Tax=unclassified Streptomyces TaxID=2593676 RepID=UPI0033DA83BC
MTGADRAPPPRLTAVWDVLQCHRCLYTWRTTEPARRRADAYPEAFRLTPEAMANAPEVPAVPPLRDRA